LALCDACEHVLGADDNFVDLLPHRWKPPAKPGASTIFDP
jgi:hypothetical protein